MDRRQKELDGYLDTLDKQVAHALTDPNAKTAEGIALAGEIRGHIKSLDAKNRFAFVSEAIASGDKDSAVAALRAAQPELMRGVTRGVFHKNTASRKMSRLSARVKALG